MTTPRIRKSATSTDGLWTDTTKNDQGHITVCVLSEKMRGSARFKAAWENARKLDYYARWGFVRRSDAADTWAVVGDLGEIEGYKSRTEEARHYERVLRSGEDSWRGSNGAFIEGELLPCITPRDLFEGPLLPWPEIERYADFVPRQSSSQSQSQGRVEFIGLQRTMVPAGETEIIELSGMTAFCVTNLYVNSRVASAFMVHDIRRSSRGSMFANADGIPAILFSDFSEDIFGPGADVDAGETLTIVVENVSGEEQVFEGAFKAYVLEAPASVDPEMSSPFPPLVDAFDPGAIPTGSGLGELDRSGFTIGGRIPPGSRTGTWVAGWPPPGSPNRDG